MNAVKTIVHPVSGGTFKLGRRRPIARGPRLRLGNYLLRTFPAAPTAVDYSDKAITELGQVLMNNSLGCCTASGAFHIEGVLLGNAGVPLTWTDDQVTKFYSATTGYVPGDDSTDQGGDEQTVLNYWQQNGLISDGSHKITGWVSINGINQAEVKAALWLFENCYFGVELPDEWLNPMPAASGFTWTTAGPPNPENGHCFVGVAYDEIGVTIDTWGMLGKMTWAAVAKYAATSGHGELYAVLGQDAIDKATAKSPAGFDFSQLAADLDSFR